MAVEFNFRKYTVNFVSGEWQKALNHCLCCGVVNLHHSTDREAVQQLEARVRSARSTCGEKVSQPSPATLSC